MKTALERHIHTVPFKSLQESKQSGRRGAASLKPGQATSSSLLAELSVSRSCEQHGAANDLQAHEHPVYSLIRVVVDSRAAP